jgi:glycosyltransferase involved in cell wall biosynthesis
MESGERISVILAESGAAVGGAERVVWELATRLPDYRYDVQVWLSPKPGIDELADSLEAHDIPVRRVAEIRSRWHLRSIVDTWHRFRRARPTVLHWHRTGAATGHHFAAVARAAGVPHLVVSEHRTSAEAATPLDAAGRSLLAEADAVTAVCASTMESLVREHGLDRARVRVVPYGADLPDEQSEWPAARKLRDRLGVGTFRPLWVCASRLEETKGHAVFLQALTEVKRRGLDFVVAIAGEGSLRRALERRVDELQLGARVHFLGRLESIGPLLLAADACVLPSLAEGLPLGLLEAMARERPVLATKVGGMVEAVEEGVSGRLVPPNEPLALADVLEEFHARPDIARRLGVAAAERVRAHYTWDKVVSAFEAVYDDVLGLASFSAPVAPGKRGSR